MYRAERQVRVDGNVGLPENGQVTIKGQAYRIEAIGLHHPSGAADGNIHELGGHYSCFVSDAISNTLGQGLHFNDDQVRARRSPPYDHNSLEKGVVFLTLKKM